MGFKGLMRRSTALYLMLWSDDAWPRSAAAAAVATGNASVRRAVIGQDASTQDCCYSSYVTATNRSRPPCPDSAFAGIVRVRKFHLFAIILHTRWNFRLKFWTDDSRYKRVSKMSARQDQSINQSKSIFQVITENYNVINAIALERLPEKDVDGVYVLRTCDFIRFCRWTTAQRVR